MTEVLPSGAVNSKSTYSMGVDLNRKGADATAFVVLEKPFNSEKCFLVYMEVHNYNKLTEAIGRILYLHSIFNFKKIYIDTTGLGGGVTDVLTEKISNGVIEEVMFTKNTKAEMFYNLKLLMQQQKIHIPNYVTDSNSLSKTLYYQLLEIHQEFTGNSEIPKIYHTSTSHDDLVCALCLAALHFKPANMIKKHYSLSGVAKR